MPVAVADGAREHVGRPAGNRCERRLGADQPVRGFVERAVARRHDHDVDAVGRGLARELAAWSRPVVATISIVWPAASVARMSCRRRSRHRRRDRVHDEPQPHAGDTIRSGRLRSRGPWRPTRLAQLTAEIVECRACPRLVEWREQVAREKRAVVPRRGLLGPSGAGLRRPRRPGAAARAGSGRARRQPHRAGCSPATGRATGCSPRCTAPASRTSRAPSEPATASSSTTRTSPRRCGARHPTTSRLPEERDRCFPFLVREIDLLARLAGDRRARRLRVRSRVAGARRGRSTCSRGPRPRFAHGLEVEVGPLHRARLLPPEPAEHLHRAPHRADARRRAGARPRARRGTDASEVTGSARRSGVRFPHANFRRCAVSTSR